MAKTITPERVVMQHADGRTAVADSPKRRIALEFDGFRVVKPEIPKVKDTPTPKPS